MILVISGTNRKDSNTRIIVDMYLHWLNDKGVISELIDLQELPNDFAFSALYENAGSNITFNTLEEKIKKAGKILMVVPEYNGSFPGVLKCFLDGLRYPSSPLEGKEVALTGLSSGPLGGAIALSHLTDIMHYYNATVIPVMPRIAFVDSKINNDKILQDCDFELELMQQQLGILLNR